MSWSTERVASGSRASPRFGDGTGEAPDLRPRHRLGLRVATRSSDRRNRRIAAHVGAVPLMNSPRRPRSWAERITRRCGVTAEHFRSPYRVKGGVAAGASRRLGPKSEKMESSLARPDAVGLGVPN